PNGRVLWPIKHDEPPVERPPERAVVRHRRHRREPRILEGEVRRGMRAGWCVAQPPEVWIWVLDARVAADHTPQPAWNLGRLLVVSHARPFACSCRRRPWSLPVRPRG